MQEKTKQKLTLALIIATTLPFALLVKHPASWSVNNDNLRSLSAFVSSASGYIGIGLLLWMYILGTRSVTGLYFKDLSWTIRVHNWLGKYGMLLVFLHPMTATYYYGEKLFVYAALPNISTEFEKHVTLGRLAYFSLLFVWFTSAIIRGKIKYRPWKYLHYIAYAVLPLALLHTKEIGPSLDRPLVLFGYVCVVVTFLTFTMLRMRHLFGYGKEQFVVEKSQQITSEIYLLTLRGLGKKISLKKGQYIYLQIKLLGEEHPFSAISYDQKNNRLYVAYKVFGSFTQKLSKIQPSDTLYIDGPYGVFTEEVTDMPNQKSVFIAGGIGVTPFAEHVIDRSSLNLPTTLFYCAQTAKSAAFRNRLKQALGSNFIEILSREETPPATNSERGYLDEVMLKKYLGQSLDSYHYYICGPAELMHSIENILHENNVPKNAIHLEEFSF